MPNIIVYRHAEPVVSDNEIILGHDFPLWVSRYNASDILTAKAIDPKEPFILASTLKRSVETGKLLGREVREHSLLREAEVPLIRFPAFRMKAKYWLMFSRILWLLGFYKDCESFDAAKQRINKITDLIHSYLNVNKKVVMVGHGFMNRLLRKRLIQQGWSLKTNEGNGFMSKMVFKKEQL